MDDVHLSAGIIKIRKEGVHFGTRAGDVRDSFPFAGFDHEVIPGEFHPVAIVSKSQRDWSGVGMIAEEKGQFDPGGIVLPNQNLWMERAEQEGEFAVPGLQQEDFEVLFGGHGLREHGGTG